MTNTGWPEYDRLRYSGRRPQARVEWRQAGHEAIHIYVSDAIRDDLEVITAAVGTASVASSVSALAERLSAELGAYEFRVIAGTDGSDPLDVVVRIAVLHRRRP